ncbi:MAG: acyltransferase [Actinomycetota bacterium]|nr:acyltransferase [Actinomycetota bacterium]
MSDETPSRSAAFRGDIQGMRAVAVLAVIVGHSGLGPFPGGFIGVDVFFVISGFLITGLIVGEALHGDRLSLAGFYGRRARRILPAASLVLVVTVAASLYWLSFLDAIDVAQDALWSALFAANLRFAAQGVDYFALEDSPSPLQHYWSLAVEEQFYVVWPLLVIAALWWIRRRDRGDGLSARRTRRLLMGAIVVLGAASLVWSVLRTPEEPQSAYFSTLTRGWELAAGAAVAIAVQSGRPPFRRWVAEILGWGGLAAVVVACVVYDIGEQFPGHAALLPVVGTAVLIWSGGGRVVGHTWVSRLLALAPLRTIGDWSYSLYLWHWPLIVIPEVRLDRVLTTGETLVAIAATFVLSFLTFRFVETPFRTGKGWRRPRRSLVLYPASLVLVVPVALGGWAWADRLGSERGDNPAVTIDAFGIDSASTESLVEASVRASQAGWPIPSDLTPDLLDLSDDIADVGECDYIDPDVRALCPRGDADAAKVMVVTGDSHARAWIPAFEQIAQESGYVTYYLVKPQCTAAFVDPGRLGSGEPWPECEEFHQWVREQVAELRPDLMIVATSPPPSGVYDAAGELLTTRDEVAAELVTGFDDMFSAYEPLTDRLLLLADVPRLPVDPGTCLSQPSALLADCTFPPTEQSSLIRDLSVAAADRAGLESVDPAGWLCADGLCPVVIGSTIAWRDRGHISTTRSAELAQPLGEALGLLPRGRDH